ncbi:biotin transporter BioY [Lachnospiraceae bacterium 54-53]
MNTVQSSETNTASSVRRRISTKELVLTGMFAAVLAVISQISVPMPTGVPITIQIFGVVLVGSILGWRLGFMAALVYVLLGAAGLPIFANFKGGIQSILGVTGGYIWSWPLMALLCGIRPKTGSKTLNTILAFLFPIMGTLVNEAIGGLQWAALAGDKSVWSIFTYSMVAFIPKDIILTILAVVISLPIRKALSKQL